VSSVIGKDPDVLHGNKVLTPHKRYTCGNPSVEIRKQIQRDSVLVCRTYCSVICGIVASQAKNDLSRRYIGTLVKYRHNQMWPLK
jgi:hypothetical protein